jgi:hypothetical protein
MRVARKRTVLKIMQQCFVTSLDVASVTLADHNRSCQ